MTPGNFPSAAEEELVDTMSLDDFLIQNKEATFMLKVTGDSMIDAGILAGDMVLVERGKKPHSGSIVIIRTDGEDYTLAYFGRTKEPHTVEAVVVAVIRRY